MVKGGKGNDSRDRDRDTLNSALNDKPYKDGILSITRNTVVRSGDFDNKAIALLDFYESRGKGTEACAHLQKALKSVERDRISNWRAYVYTLLRGFDKSAYAEMKAEREEQRGPEARRRRSSAGASNQISSIVAAESKKAADTTPPSSPSKAKGEGTPIRLDGNISGSKQQFHVTAAEFVPGKTSWTNEPSRSFSHQAAEFVPGKQWASSSEAPTLKPSSAEFVPGQMAWTGAVGSAGVGTKSLKPQAAEFVPGQSGWSGAMPKSKAKAKAKTPKGGTAPTAAAKSAGGKADLGKLQPERPGPISRTAQSPAASPTLDADTAAGTGSRAGLASAAAASPGSTSGTSASQNKRPGVGAVSEDPACRNALTAGSSDKSRTVVPRTLSLASTAKGKFAVTLGGVLSSIECKELLRAAEKFGFRPTVEQDRAGGSPNSLLSKDEWLAAELWKRVKDHVPAVWKGCWVLGFSDQFEYECCQASSTQDEKDLILQLFLKHSTDRTEGEALLLESGQLASEASGAKHAALRTRVKCSQPSFIARVHTALGLGGPSTESSRRRNHGLLMLVLAAAAASLPLVLQKRRLK
eukprot:TRINITY_DN36881_c0_g1_i1.p1 TRINITY_DN36881_c0_g1~~TRINITY_DN36881_c0_g1_i1.p1  ORF type:complete len:606 (+),score=132.51 TRINITY_DN36881_c0_g1_i1:78-1820(+)